LEQFDTVARLLASGGPEAALDYLVERFRASGEYGRLFEARLMRQRRRMGLPLAGGAPADLDDASRSAYDAEVGAAARETAELYLAAGNIPAAWPYYRALGETGPVREAIGRWMGGDDLDQILDIALGERVHPVRGFELLLEHHGTCRAITCFDGIQDEAARAACLPILMNRLHSELVRSLQSAIERNEGTAPDTSCIPELIRGRDWLFGEYDYYVDTSHLVSLLRFAVESTDPQVLSQAVELAAYGARLAPMFHYKNDPPFDDIYRDHTIYLRALLGEETDAAVAHFRAKAEACDPYETGTYPAQVLVRFLVRLGRPAEAVEAFERFLKDADPNYLTCPRLPELCRMAGDRDRLLALARERGDLLGFVAASVD